ncbi:MAG: hypothetical protein RIC95_09180 [Vicingaceae bacterium]
MESGKTSQGNFLRKQWTWLSLCLFLLILAFLPQLYQNSFSFLEQTSEKALLSLGLWAELNTAAYSAASLKIPLVSGSFQGTAALLTQGFQYLELANLLIGVQLVLLSLSQSVILKVLLLLFIGMQFFEKHRSFAIKMLLLFFLVNPGLPLYTQLVKYLSQEAELDLGGKLKAELTQTHADFLEKKKAQEKKLSQRKSKQLKQREEKGKDELSFVQKAEDKVISSTDKVEDDLSLAFKDAFQVLKGALSNLIQLAVNLVVHFLLLFIVLPFLYFFLGYKLLYYLFPTSIKNN